MLKQIIIRFINGFCYSIAITMLVQLFVMLAAGGSPMLPEFMNRFHEPIIAFASQLIMVGVMSGITSAGTVIFECKKVGILVQSVIFLIIMLSAWIPVSYIAWGFHRYITSMISTICSIVVTYIICWGIQYKLCRRDIDEINVMLNKEIRNRNNENK